ncbi:MAG: type II secretion system GspH family protein [Verrucomicrobiota bacterium]|nr:type II secretion system GspH family protein [Verrucomicrobiota bacterium]
MRRASRGGGFTLFEVAIAVVIICILATLVVATASKLRARAQRAQCTANLQSLYVAANLYVQQNGSWPQIAPSTDDEASVTAHANAWIGALEPFGVPRKTWICPTMQSLLGVPDYLNPANARLDYMPMPFDDKPTSPHQWPRQPWFVETGDVHGNGNLIIFTDGSISDLKRVAGTARPPSQ